MNKISREYGRSYFNGSCQVDVPPNPIYTRSVKGIIAL
jgi:hypothetical protein